jgi:hypothetical protein
VRAGRSETVAADYYVGRGPSEAKAAANEANARLVFVSAGLGLVDATIPVPHYSLTTVSGDPDGVGAKVEGNFSSGLWWAALRAAQGGSGLAVANLYPTARGLAVVALPGSYLRMIGAELSLLPAALLARTRIVGAPRDAVPAPLLASWMPYDVRFDGAGSPNSGTRSDFPQRAARHFFQVVFQSDPDADAAAHAASVQRCMEALPYPEKLSRRTGSDAELIGVISGLLPRTHGKSGRTLALLRREAGWACEQSRFRRLFAVATGQRPEP